MSWKLMLFIALAISLSVSADDFEDEDFVIDEKSTVEADKDLEPETSSLEYKSPYATPGKFYFSEHFDDLGKFEKTWIKSQARKDDIAEDIAKYDGEWSVESPQRQILKQDLGLVLKTQAKHAAIASRLTKPFVFSDKSLIVQYEVTLQDGQECGGSYIKLLSSGKDTTELKTFNDKTPYTIMFGPDKCGNDIKLHFIFRHVNPLNGSIEEKHCKKSKERLEEPFKDKQPHLYRLVIKPDNTYTISVDHKAVNEGSLLTDFTPPVNPPSEIDDPEDKKPTDWDEREMIPDPTAVKPDDWNDDEPPQIPDPNAVKPDGWLDEEEEMIPDGSAVKPDDWDVEMDGTWEAPLINNPKCEKAVGCGKWKAPLVPNEKFRGKWRAPNINNPNYQGKWAPRKIPNPDYFEDLNPFKMTPISAVGIEIWSMSKDILFDNIIITDDVNEADSWAAQTYDLKRKQLDQESGTLWHRAMRSMNYKPGWWAVYFIYCAIPVSIYIWYLVRRAREETLINKLTKMTSDYPWLWAVYLAITIFPILFVVYSIYKKQDKKNSVGKAKKDDNIVNEDDSTDLPTATNDKKAAGGGDEVESSKTNPKRSKSDLDEPVAQEKVSTDDENSKDVESVDNESASDGVEAETLESKPEATSASNTGARKRKPRKD